MNNDIDDKMTLMIKWLFNTLFIATIGEKTRNEAEEKSEHNQKILLAGFKLMTPTSEHVH